MKIETNAKQAMIAGIRPTARFKARLFRATCMVFLLLFFFLLNLEVNPFCEFNHNGEQIMCFQWLKNRRKSFDEMMTMMKMGIAHFFFQPSKADDLGSLAI